MHDPGSTPRFRFAPQPASAQAPRQAAAVAPEDYLDREGYVPGFIDPATPVALPRLGEERRRDAVSFAWKGAQTHVLDYVHFSAAVSRSRRLPIFSACNIDGAQAKSVARSNDWRYDPRIPQDCQILDGVYGNERDGYFSRGHMTRRQDPDWGAQDLARRADADTFHVTNAAPQVQDFNAGLWGRIEDYILANARRDSMQVSVFTGPVFADDDPVIHAVQVPVRFWKVVAFVHDGTAQLTATGYVASQARAIADLGRKTFVFGDIENQQRPLAAIESLAGLSFGELTGRDVLAGAGTDFAAVLRETRDIMLA